MKIFKQISVICPFSVIALLALFLTDHEAGAWETDTDRPGMNYKNFDLNQSYPKLCEDECLKDQTCKA